MYHHNVYRICCQARCWMLQATDHKDGNCVLNVKGGAFDSLQQCTMCFFDTTRVRIVIPTIEHGFIRSMYTKLRSQCIVKTNIIRGPFHRRNFYLHQTNMTFPLLSSAKKYSVWTELLSSSGRAPSKPSETPRWQITPCPVSIQRDVLHIAVRLLFHRFFALGCSSTLNYQSSVVATSDYVSE
jgi:hypothetical protein